MLPSRINSRAKQPRVPLWLAAVVAVFVVFAALGGWIVAGLGDAPESQQVEVNVPLKF